MFNRDKLCGKLSKLNIIFCLKICVRKLLRHVFKVYLLLCYVIWVKILLRNLIVSGSVITACLIINMIAGSHLSLIYYFAFRLCAMYLKFIYICVYILFGPKILCEKLLHYIFKICLHFWFVLGPKNTNAQCDSKRLCYYSMFDYNHYCG